MTAEPKHAPSAEATAAATVDIAAEQAAVATAAAALTAAEPEAILRWAFDRYGDQVALASSFGGPSGVVLMELVQRLQPATAVFYLDTGYLFPETLATVQAARQRWPLARIERYSSDLSVGQQARLHGEALWERDPDRCCEIRKLEPNRRALAGKRAWIAGLRRDQSVERAQTPAVQWDAKFGLVKVNPLVNWDEQRVWAFIARHDLPYNPLHDRGYPSIGCTNCTRAVQPGEDPRAGRWSGTDKTECGLHVP